MIIDLLEIQDTVYVRVCVYISIIIFELILTKNKIYLFAPLCKRRLRVAYLRTTMSSCDIIHMVIFYVERMETGEGVSARIFIELTVFWPSSSA